MEHLKTNYKKLKSVIVTILFNSADKKGYDFMNEALLLIKSKNLFPEFHNDEELLKFLRRYKTWREFEKMC
jgi:hypothetical protein